MALLPPRRQAGLGVALVAVMHQHDRAAGLVGELAQRAEQHGHFVGVVLLAAMHLAQRVEHGQGRLMLGHGRRQPAELVGVVEAERLLQRTVDRRDQDRRLPVVAEAGPQALAHHGDRVLGGDVERRPLGGGAAQERLARRDARDEVEAEEALPLLRPADEQDRAPGGDQAGHQPAHPRHGQRLQVGERQHAQPAAHGATHPLTICKPAADGGGRWSARRRPVGGVGLFPPPSGYRGSAGGG